MVRAGLREFLQEEAEFEIGEAGSGNEALAQMHARRWDLVILDINMPDRSGVDVLQRLLASYPATRVLIVSGFPEQQYAANMLKAGAAGYLPKECAPQELLLAVRSVLRGRRYLTAGMAQLLASIGEGDRAKSLHDRLSRREFQIFCKVAVGYSVSDIALELGLSPKTVSTYRCRILRKMGFCTNTDLTRYALETGIVRF
jgi:DNA-binding NarL/FixJ family response regulator